MRFELQPYNRDVSDDELLADLRAVARTLSINSLTQATYDKHGRFCAATLKKRFGTWNRAVSAAGLVPKQLMNIDPALIIADIQRVATMLGITKLTRQQYDRYGEYSEAPIYRHFGRWKAAVAAAKLEPGWNYEISDEELFDNLERVWRHLGRQPTINEMMPPLSRYSGGTYANRFDGYRKALEAFVAAIDARSPSCSDEVPEPVQTTGVAGAPQAKRRGSRTVNWRLRFLTLRRDGFRCRTCGRSPANEPGVELEVDHVVPWSDGGETELKNLQSLCQKCNGGKSNLPFITE